MMKGMLKRALGVVAAAAMAVTGMAALSGTANAAEVTDCTDDTCMITVNGTANQLDGHTFKTIKLASYDVYTNDDKSQTMTLVTEDDPVKSTVTTALNGIVDSEVPENADPLAWAMQENKLDQSTTSPWFGTDGTTRKLADALVASLNNTANDATPKLNGDKTAATFTFTEPGLYLIIDQGPCTNGQVSSSKALGMIAGTKLTLMVAGEDGSLTETHVSYGTVNMKNDVTTITKTVNDKAAQTDDEVTYTLSTNIPNYIGYKVSGYTFKITDKFKDNPPLQYVADSLEVKVKKTDTPTEVTLKAQDYTLTGFGQEGQAADSFTLDLSSYIQKNAFGEFFDTDDTFSDASLVDATVTVTYNAKVTGQIAEEGALNTPTVTYTNDPSTNTTGEVPGPGQKVFNFQYTVKKVDRQTGAALQGAEFTIYRGNEASEANRIDTQTTDKNGLATFEGLDADTYTIKETGVPEGYINSNVQFTVTIKPTYSGENENMTVTNVDYVISGVEIGQPDAGLVNNVTEDNGVGGGTVEVQNAKSIFELPATGAAGITMFVVLGLLIAGAGVTVYMKSRSVRKAMRA